MKNIILHLLVLFVLSIDTSAQSMLYRLKTPNNANAYDCQDSPNWALRMSPYPPFWNYYYLSDGYYVINSDGTSELVANFQHYSYWYLSGQLTMTLGQPYNWETWASLRENNLFFDYCGIADNPINSEFREVTSCDFYGPIQYGFNQSLELFPLQEDSLLWVQIGNNLTGAPVEQSIGMTFTSLYTYGYVEESQSEISAILGEIALELDSCPISIANNELIQEYLNFNESIYINPSNCNGTSIVIHDLPFTTFRIETSAMDTLALTTDSTGQVSYLYESTTDTTLFNVLDKTHYGCTTVVNEHYISVLFDSSHEIIPSLPELTLTCNQPSITLQTTPVFPYTSWYNVENDQFLGFSSALVVTQPGTYHSIASDNFGSCSTTRSISIQVDTTFTNSYSNQTISINDGDSYEFNELYLNTAGTYFDTLETAYGCDSILELRLLLRDSTICPSSPITIQTCSNEPLSLSYQFTSDYSVQGAIAYSWSTGSNSNQIELISSQSETITCTFYDDEYQCQVTTILNVITADSDQDGICDLVDFCPNSPEPGSSCDDNNPCSYLDVVSVDCTCESMSDVSELFSMHIENQRICDNQLHFAQIIGIPNAVVNYSINNFEAELTLNDQGIGQLQLPTPSISEIAFIDTVTINLWSFNIGDINTNCDRNLNISETIFLHSFYTPSLSNLTSNFDDCYFYGFISEDFAFSYQFNGQIGSKFFLNTSFPVFAQAGLNASTSSSSFEIEITEQTWGNYFATEYYGNGFMPGTALTVRIDSAQFNGCTAFYQDIVDIHNFPLPPLEVWSFYSYGIEGSIAGSCAAGYDYTFTDEPCIPVHYYNINNSDIITNYTDYIFEYEIEGETILFDFNSNDEPTIFNECSGSFFFVQQLNIASATIGNRTFSLIDFGSGDLRLAYHRDYTYEPNDTVEIIHVGVHSPNGCFFPYNPGDFWQTTYILQPEITLPAIEYSINCESDIINLAPVPSELLLDYSGNEVSAKVWVSGSDTYPLFLSYAETLAVNSPGQYIHAAQNGSNCITYLQPYTIYASSGALCNDGDTCTTNDMYNEICFCSGSYQDSDFDGTCDALDECNGIPAVASILSSASQLNCNNPVITLSSAENETTIWSDSLGNNYETSELLISNPGVYLLTVINEYGCRDSSFIEISENKNLPIAQIELSADSNVINCIQPSLALTASGGSMYNWNNGSSFDSTIYASLAGEYYVEVIGENGCRDTAYQTITQGICPTPGCMSSEACNYNPAANSDDNSCVYPGCTDTLAINYSASAGCLDSSCLYVSGCTDELACNFFDQAVVDDGTCNYPGCTDSLACNYDIFAGCNDGSCYTLESFNIEGNQIQFLQDTATFTYPYSPGSSYHWEVSGGGLVLISTGNSSIAQIYWFDTGLTTIMVQETDSNGCVGPWSALEIVVETPPNHISIVVTSEFHLFPNPAKDVINIIVPKKLIGSSLQCRNSLGALLTKHTIEKSEFTMDINHLSSGVYLFTIEDGKYVQKQRLIKE